MLLGSIKVSISMTVRVSFRRQKKPCSRQKPGEETESITSRKKADRLLKKKQKFWSLMMNRKM